MKESESMLDNILYFALEVLMLLCLCLFIYNISKYMFVNLNRLPQKSDTKNINEGHLITLFCEDPNLKNKKISFSSSITIGRGEDNIISLKDQYISHYHAVITPINNLYEIEDLNSKNHTYVNDEILIGKRFLKNGDIIKIGNATFRFER